MVKTNHKDKRFSTSHHTSYTYRNRLLQQYGYTPFLNILSDLRKKMQTEMQAAMAAPPTFRTFCRSTWIFILTCFLLTDIRAQETRPSLSLDEALQIGVKNFQRIQAKQNYLQSSEALTRNARNEYLPNVIAAVQQNYGTINGQFGPLGAVGVLGVASAGPVYEKESWNAAFGALYIVSTNWEVFTFGRVRSRIDAAKAQVSRDSADLAQEEFIHRIKISGAYLNLLVAQQLIRTAQSNLTRAEIVQRTVRARALSGLNPGVDSALANAEVSRAKLSLIDLRNNEQQVRSQFAQLLAMNQVESILDTTFFTRTPTIFTTDVTMAQNPQVKFYQARINQAEKNTRLVKRSIMPGLTLFGVYQARASGFDYNYTPEFPDRFSKSYSDGINPSRYNYVAGVSLSWNLVSPLKVRQQARSQQFISEAYRNEYDQVSVQLQSELILADQRIENSLLSIREVPLQYQAASDAYIQKSVLYKNGLTTLVDLQQAIYALNRAEIDRSVAFLNVWQALLLKAAASGDFNLFSNQAQAQ
ncbi:TolC family protein [Ohtaekwangia koreensis]|nr:TolC family protein [Ohtaekwangia koreensis]